MKNAPLRERAVPIAEQACEARAKCARLFQRLLERQTDGEDQPSLVVVNSSSSVIGGMIESVERAARV